MKATLNFFWKYFTLNFFSPWLTKNMIVKMTMIVHAIQHPLNFQLVRFVSIINDIEIV